MSEIKRKESPLARSRAPIYQEESRLRQRKRKLVDRWMRWVIAGGGFAIIATVLAILFFIGIEVLPLFQSAEIVRSKSFSVEEILDSPDTTEVRPVAVGLEEHKELGYLILEEGTFQFFSVNDGSPRERFVLEEFQGDRITSAWQSLDGRQIVLGTEGGKILEVLLDFNPEFYEGTRSFEPQIATRLLAVETEETALEYVTFAGGSDGSMGIGTITNDGRVVVHVQEFEETLFGEIEVTSSRFELNGLLSAEPSAVAIDEAVRNVYVGTSEGMVYHWSIGIQRDPEFIGVTRRIREDNTAITALTFLIGGRTLLVGDVRGNVTAMALVRDSTSTRGWRLTRIHEMESHPTAVIAFAPSARGKGFISGDETGNLYLQHTTSERFLAQFHHSDGAPLRFVHYAPKADGAITLDTENRLDVWNIENEHPEAGFQALFRRVWYEGYNGPEYVWQSSAATDDFEPKLSVVPLIFGSIKGTIYALILAVPLAIFAALYTSQFMHSTLRNYIKPTIEIMAALPSVVLGFLAGLWLAPIIEKVVPGVFLMFFVLTGLILIVSLVWRQIPQRLRGRFRPGIEATLLVPVIVLGVWISLKLSGSAEVLFFDGNFTQWIFDSFDLRYDQRNALIVGFAMGFAVIPIIYTISEDSLSNVPRHLISGSLALGATRWQTAVRVVIPTAAAGIFSAIMIGFGRAVGETMIVLMATGNTPIMDWNPFNGFRTLAANIAVEIPEAPHGGTLYRVLFLTALLLFLITFAINTIAEIVRQRVREKYQKL
jgi:phosphate transport system permease protein